MAKTEINISSKAVEIGLESVKGFLGKLVGPTVEEMGLFLKDHVALWRFGNQVKMLNKAKAICEKHGINPKQISPKLLVPLLEGASLEEDEEMQNKWANMLASMVDPDQNLQNHVFPYILGQLSRAEYEFLEKSYLKFLDLVRTSYDNLEIDRVKIFEKVSEIKKLKKVSHSKSLDDELDNLQRNLEWSQKFHEQEFIEAEKINVSKIEKFQIANLVRLGLISVRTEIQTRKQNDWTIFSNNQPVINVTSFNEYLITDLAKKMISICSENC